jgi:hypothetical protein
MMDDILTSSGRAPLHILFTMDCEPAATKWAPEGPKHWELSARSIEGFCNLLLGAGYRPTLFAAPRCAFEHAPMLDELAGRGAEIGLQVHPPSLLDGRFKRVLGDYNAEDQHALIESASDDFDAALGFRPRSFRGGRFSASDETFRVLYELGFRQGSLSLSGRKVARHAAAWEGAIQDPHFTDRADRLRVGSLPFLEIPVTSNPTQFYRSGYPNELCIETGPFKGWHNEIIESQLARMAAEQLPFRTLCFYTANTLPYHDQSMRCAETILALLDYFDTLSDTYEIIPVTAAAAHEHFRLQGATTEV